MGNHDNMWDEIERKVQENFHISDSVKWANFYILFLIIKWWELSEKALNMEEILRQNVRE